MLMLMVFVMDVRVFVCHFLMRMLVFVALRNMQPDSTGAATPPPEQHRPPRRILARQVCDRLFSALEFAKHHPCG